MSQEDKERALLGFKRSLGKLIESGLVVKISNMHDQGTVNFVCMIEGVQVDKEGVVKLKKVENGNNKSQH